MLTCVAGCLLQAGYLYFDSVLYDGIVRAGRLSRFSLLGIYVPERTQKQDISHILILAQDAGHLGYPATKAWDA